MEDTIKDIDNVFNEWNRDDGLNSAQAMSMLEPKFKSLQLLIRAEIIKNNLLSKQVESAHANYDKLLGGIKNILRH